jgi:hypothetical protein
VWSQWSPFYCQQNSFCKLACLLLDLHLYPALCYQMNNASVLHCEDNNDSTWKNELKPQVQALYQLKGRLDSTDRRVLEIPISETLKMPNKTLQDWIKRTGNFVKIGLQRANHRLQQGNHTITAYFQLQPHPCSRIPYPRGQRTPQPDAPETFSPNKARKENHRPLSPPHKCGGY